MSCVLIAIGATSVGACVGLLLFAMLATGADR